MEGMCKGECSCESNLCKAECDNVWKVCLKRNVTIYGRKVYVKQNVTARGRSG